MMKVAARRNDVSLFVPLLLAFAALAIIAVTLPMSGVHVPGERHLQALFDRVPQPWKPPKPVYVPAPNPADAGVLAPAAPAPATGAVSSSGSVIVVPAQPAAT